MTEPVYRDYDLSELNRQYDIEATNPDFESVLHRYVVESAAAAARCDALLDQSYGDDPLQKIDFYRPRNAIRDRRLPVMLYLHGGYWRAGDKSGRAFPAPVFTQSGVIWASVNYRLAPSATMDQIVDDARSAVAWVYRNALAIGADRDRLFVSGGSAGGHLTAMTLCDGWHDSYGVPSNVIKGAAAASGLYDLTPFVHTAQKDFLRLDPEAAHRNSPLFHVPESGPPLVIAWGGKETDEFERQSQSFADAYAETGSPVTRLHLEQEDHFTLMGQMSRLDSPLTQAKLILMGVS